MTARWTVWSWETIIRFRSGGDWIQRLVIQHLRLIRDQLVLSKSGKVQKGISAGMNGFILLKGKTKI